MPIKNILYEYSKNYDPFLRKVFQSNTMHDSSNDSSFENVTIDADIAPLFSTRSTEQLRIVANLRAKGIDSHVSLPQAVVCGDQSTGKSSVLQGLTGIPFPRQDGICTRFPTEIVIEHLESNKTTIDASIIPAERRDDPSKAKLLAYKRRMNGFEELPDTISEVSLLMGLSAGEGSSSGPAFVTDVLSIKVSGPTGMHLTVVDLPGLISNPSDDQRDEDVTLVQKLVDTYLRSPRTIILAVVQAGNDIANQPILRKAKKFDKSGLRTVGIITKPDLINVGSDERIASLANNKDTNKLKLGFFLIKNPTPVELKRGMTFEERLDAEIAFFNSSPWNKHALEKNRVGILALRVFVQNILDKHVTQELPKVRDELWSLISSTECSLSTLGSQRSTPAAIRMYLTTLSMRFYNVVIAGLHGNYMESDVEFFACKGNGESKLRLRACVHRLNTEFSDYMRQCGEKRKVNDSCGTEDESQRNSLDDSTDQSDSDGMIVVTSKKLKRWVKEVHGRTRGRELPGNHNYILLSELYHEQSSRWFSIAAQHLDNVHKHVVTFVESALRYVVKDDETYYQLQKEIQAPLKCYKLNAERELGVLWNDELQQPITYNHYYTDNIQKDRHSHLQKVLKGLLTKATDEDYNGKMHISNTAADVERLLVALQSRIVVDMDEQTCSEALSSLKSYYKVAMKNWVDNVAKQVIERHLLRTLTDVFSPSKIASYTDADLERLASETPTRSKRRADLEELLVNLRQSLEELE